MNVNSKIIQYLKLQSISQRKFTNDCNLSEGLLRSGNNMNSVYLKVIHKYLPKLNMNWVLFDEGEMEIKEVVNYNNDIDIKQVKEDATKYGNCKEELLGLQKKVIDLQDQIIKLK